MYNFDDRNNWRYRLNYMDKTTAELYVASLYWTIQTVVTVGYGDFAAVTKFEK